MTDKRTSDIGLEVTLPASNSDADTSVQPVSGHEPSPEAISDHARNQRTLDRPPDRTIDVSGDTLASNQVHSTSHQTPSESDIGLDVGDTLGRFRITRRVGEGGMGVVFAGLDPDLERTVAIKVLRRDPGEGSITRALRERLLREARAMARLEHVNVLTVYEVGTVGERDYIAMAFVDGGSLDQWLKRESRGWRQVLDVFIDAARGLQAAHRANLVHRDFKPGNVLVSHDGKVQVTDFGLARLDTVESAPAGTAAVESPVAPVSTRSAAGKGNNAMDLTRTGAILGTPAYMAPEQHHGEDIDTRTDQYTFCASLYEGLYGVHPFAGKTLAELLESKRAMRLQTPSRETSVPRRVRDALVRGLSFEPADRFASMNALIHALHPDNHKATRTRRRLISWLVSLFVLVALGGGFLALRGTASDNASASDRPVPDDDALADQVQTARDTLARLTVNPDHLDPIADFDQLAAHARTLGYKPLTAEVLLERANQYAWLIDMKRARGDIEESLILAQESAYDALHARAMVTLAELEIGYGADVGQKDAALRRAAATVERFGRDPVQRARVDVLRALRLGQKGKLDEAMTRFAEVYPAFERASDPLAAANASLSIGVLLSSLFQRDQALTWLQRGCVQFERHLGSRHLHTGFACSGVPPLLSWLNRHDDAEPQRRSLLWMLDGARRRHAIDSATGNSPLDAPRSLRGRVVDADGKPAVGVEVVVGHTIMSGGKYVLALMTPQMLAAFDVHIAITDAQGRYRFDGLPPYGLLGVATSDRGRSRTAVISGHHDALDFTLQPYGSVTGTIANADVQVASKIVVTLIAQRGRRSQVHHLRVWASVDGSFTFPRVAAGRYDIELASVATTQTLAIEQRQVTVTAGTPTMLSFDLAAKADTSTVEVTVTVKGRFKTSLAAARILIGPPGLRSGTMASILKQNPSQAGMRDSKPTGANPDTGEITVTVSGIEPGAHSICVLPLPSDFNDPGVLLGMLKDWDTMRVDCMQAEVAHTPARQTFSFTL